MKQQFTKCNFCKYFTGSACMTSQNAHNCAQANIEFYDYLKQNKKGNTDRYNRQYGNKRKWN